MTSVPDIFGSMVFNDETMQQRLPRHTYKALKNTVQNGEPLDTNVANIVANAMKDWAIEKGVTHYTHWFQPMNGITAEKHDSFINPNGDGKVIMEFSGKELIKGEPDASSFPSGGIRATFEARGYTAWDPTSYAFIKDNTLCIPTAFCAYGGESLDNKTPLLRSMDVINTEALRILKLFGNEQVSRVIPTVGPEQEYFLVDKELFKKRKDLVYCSRTLFGAKPPKGQDLDDHYFGAIRPRVLDFMKELDNELWKLGILAKTEHNEVAPGQHELAPVFTTVNLSTDHNQLTMELMKKIADRHDLVCLLHEKPFAGVNGSGKHNNWSITTNTGANLLDPGKTPHENAQFLLILCAVIKAVDEYQDLLRISVASAGNDHRLGAGEAPPAIISIFLGDELYEVLESIEFGTEYSKKEKVYMNIGVDVLPAFKKDSTDRNRTSPFAFTGNKFEFRMLGSANSISTANVIINTIVADELSKFAGELESAEDFNRALGNLIKRTVKEHKRILFNGNNYSDDWVLEAEKRGLLNLKTLPDAMPYFISDKNINLFKRHKIFTEVELHSRYEISLENYVKTLSIESVTMLRMAVKDILPASLGYVKELSEALVAKKTLDAGISSFAEENTLKRLSLLCENFYKGIQRLEEDLEKTQAIKNMQELADFYKSNVLASMQTLRETGDMMEVLTAARFWPYPSYGAILFSV